MIQHSKTYIDRKAKHSMLEAFNNLNLSKGKINIDFTNKLSRFLNREYLNITSSGTMAFYKILIALNIKKGDEILIPNFICNSILGPINQLNAIPVPYDNTKDNWLSNIEMILKLVSKKTRIVLINHTFGYSFLEIKKLLEKLNSDIYIVEDCCQLLTKNSEILDLEISKYSICSFYSFNATKLIATGEGGAISSNDKSFISEIEKINIGDNLSDLSCSLGTSQLDQYDEFVKKRREIAEFYFEKINVKKNQPFQTIKSIFYRYPILVKNNSKFFHEKEICFRKGVDNLIDNVDAKKRLTNSLNLMNKIISIPIYPSLKKIEAERIVSKVNELIHEN